MRLVQIADIRSGYQFRDGVAVDPTGNVCVLQAKDVREGQSIDPSNLSRVNFTSDPEPYLLHQDDVLFLSRGSRPFAMHVGEPLPDVVVANYFYIVRPRPGLALPGYLAWHINQPPAQAQLKLSHTGSHMQVISKSAFEKLTIALPPLAIQKRIADIADLAQRESALLHELSTLRRKLISKACLQSVAKATSRGTKQ